jgi:alkylation response protein AidB-like acyl-CoA dehydrogenase
MSADHLSPTPPVQDPFLYSRAVPRDLNELLDAARAFARDELRPVALQFDESEEFPRELLHRGAAQGLTCFDLPEAYGGGGIESLDEVCQVVEELTYGDSPIALVLGQGGFFAGPLVTLGTEEQRQRWLPSLCGPTPPPAALAITEPGAGSDAASIVTEARRVDGGYVLNGRKRYIGNAPVAELCVVFANVEPGSRSKGITAFVLEGGDEGFVRGQQLPKMGSRCFPAGEILLEDCFVADDRRLGQEGQGFSGLMGCFERARVQLAANSLGIGRAALEHAVEYARERQAFGKPIHEFQAVSFRLVDAKLRLDQARLSMRHAAQLADAGKPFGAEAAQAKLAASEAAWQAAFAASQTLGAAGYIRESPVQKWLRDARLDEIWDGTSDIMRLILARDLFPRN